MSEISQQIENARNSNEPVHMYAKDLIEQAIVAVVNKEREVLDEVLVCWCQHEMGLAKDRKESLKNKNWSA